MKYKNKKSNGTNKDLKFIGLVVTAIFIATRSLVTPNSLDLPAIIFVIYVMVVIMELLDRLKD